MCSVVGIWGGNTRTEASILAYLGSYAQQNRGQESTGIVSSDGCELHEEIGMGRVSDFFTEERLSRLPGHRAIGHNRYATTGTSCERNAQPLLIDCKFGRVAIAHNGNLVNTSAVRDTLFRSGAVFSSTTDTEIILQLLSRSVYLTLTEAFVDALKRVEGAYSLVLMSRDEMIIARDPRGFRPLCMGSLPDGGFVFASETCALDLIEASYVRDIRPGEVLTVSSAGLTSLLPFDIQKQRPCLFELVYFSRPDSIVFGQNAYLVRKAFGRQLAREAPVCGDVVVPVPDSGVPAALGYSEESGIPFELGLTRNHYVGRTFIEPSQKIRNFGVKVKHNPTQSVIAGKRVIVVDDSIVRGTTSMKLVEMIRRAGAREVHLRISSPPPREPCLYGIDTPKKEDYIANRFSVEETRKYLNADSLWYLSYEGMLAVAQSSMPQSFCTTCWTGTHPFPILEFPR